MNPPVNIDLSSHRTRAAVLLIGSALLAGHAAAHDGHHHMGGAAADAINGLHEKVDAEGLTAKQRAFLDGLAQVPLEVRANLQICFHPETPVAYVEAVHALIAESVDFERYELATRWPGAQGDPIDLTYSFVPDGVSVPANAGLSGGVNQIHSMFNSAIGAGTWPGLFAQVFDRWSELLGTSYTNVADDGAPLFASVGGPTRGDLRISAIPLDGFNGVLAYNNFPTAELGVPGGGDMVMDSDDANNWAQPANNFRFLRNTISHEHGHGMGLLHVCPDNGSKLMEPFINVNFDGPQLDDIRAGQRHYGDNYENNDSAAAAAPLGSLAGNSVALTDLSIDDNTDVDYYAIDLQAQSSVDITLRPIGFTYSTGPQGFFGCFFADTSNVNALNVHNVNLTLIDSDGSTVLASAPAAGAGAIETISGAVVPNAGTYYVRVSTSTGTNDVQTYELDIAGTLGVALGACCLGDGSCVSDITAAACDILPGTYRGDRSLCSIEDCAPPAPACPSDCVPDNGDGTFGNGLVNIDDVLAVINEFGAGPGSPCDIAPDNGDGTFGNGIVNIDDLLTVINDFGPCD
jgi:hypothetical protein